MGGNGAGLNSTHFNHQRPFSPHTNPKECTLKPSGFLKNVFILHAFPALVHCSSLYVCAAEYFKALTLDIIQSAK